MESRLPKPKIVTNISQITKDIQIKMDPSKVINKEQEMPQTSSNKMSERLKKAKSTMNIHTKETNENKPPIKSGMIRSKTLSTITRPTVAKAVKRPAPTSNAPIDAKKPFTRTTVKPTTTQRVGGASATTNKAVPAASKKPQNGTAATAKPPKWDLKGRLAHTSDELLSVRQQHKEVAFKCSELQELVDTLQGNESKYKTEAEELGITNKTLDAELKILNEKMTKFQEERDSLTARLKNSEESYAKASSLLQEVQEKCASQGKLLSTKISEADTLMADVEAQRIVIKDLNEVKEDLQSLVHKMDKDCRVLHNAIQELKGNIRVFCRVRPKTANETMKGLCAINFLDDCTIDVAKSDGSDSISCSGKLRGTRQEFSFDKVFPPSATQEDIFEELALLVQSALEGYNVCVFAYGQTGSGKTYTMEGQPGIETEGMIPRTVRHIFKQMKQFELLGWEFRIEASFLEIYNEHIVDLLDSQVKSHDIRMADSKGNDLYVTNLKVEEIHSALELQECLLTAQRNRAVATTHANERSSRSHSVARIRLIGTHQTKEEVSIGNLNLVDLAGSERLKGEESARVAETKNINKSLANLGNVILALLKKQEHIPYRNSKLTHLLMPSLGGNSKTLMLLNISPLDDCYNETLNSLRFASSVNSCKTGNIKRTRTVLQNTA